MALVNEERGIRVLTLDGTGMRCIAQLTALEYIESSVGHGRKLHEMFDFICGTGFGGLFAIAIGVNQKTVDDCRRLLQDISNEFNLSYFNFDSWYRWIRGRGVCNTDSFTKILQKHLGDLPWQTLSWLNPKVCVVSGHKHLNGRTTPCLWRTYSSQLGNNEEAGFNICQTYQAARATASLPGSFEPFVYGPDRLQFVDGSVVASNPTEIALFEASKIWPGRRVDVVISIGCGVSMGNDYPGVPPSVLKSGVTSIDIEELANRVHKGVKRWVDMLLKYSKENDQMYAAHHVQSRNIPAYVRVDPPVGKPIRLNENDPAVVRAFEERTHLYLESNIELREEIQKLSSYFIE